MNIKWKNPQNGGTLFFVHNGYRYYVMDELNSSWWHVERRKIIEQKRRRFKTYKELHFDMFGENPAVIHDGEDVEIVAKMEIMRRTNWVNCGGDYRMFKRDGHSYAVDMLGKEWWEYSEIEKVSPSLPSMDEAKKYIEEELQEKTLF